VNQHPEKQRQQQQQQQPTMSGTLPPPDGKTWGKVRKRVVGEPSESLMRIPQHVAHAIAGHIRQKKTNETRMAVKTSEIKIEQMVEDFKYQRKIELMKMQEKEDLERSAAEKAASIEASRAWAEQCKDDHHKMMKRREDESRARNAQLREEAIEMKKAIDAARDSQLDEDKTKIMMLKQEFADRKSMYAKMKSVREEEEAEQTRLVMEAYQAEREFVAKQREEEQTAMRIKLKTQREEAIEKRKIAQEKVKAKQAREREVQARERAQRKKLDAKRLQMQLKAQEEMKANNRQAKALRKKEQEKHKAQQLEIARLQKAANAREKEAERQRMQTQVNAAKEEKAAKRLRNVEAKKLSAAIAIKKAAKREEDMILKIADQKAEKERIRIRLDKEQAEADARLDTVLQKAKENADRKIALIQKLNGGGSAPR